MRHYIVIKKKSKNPTEIIPKINKGTKAQRHKVSENDVGAEHCSALLLSVGVVTNREKSDIFIIRGALKEHEGLIRK